MRNQGFPAGSFFRIRRRSGLSRIAAFAAVGAIATGGAFAAAPKSVTAQAFGGAILVADSSILVGEAAHEREPGTVWTYRQDGGGWIEAGALRAPEPMVHDGFGRALARSGEFFFVGAGGADGGRVYVYRLADVASADPRPIQTLGGPDARGFGSALAASDGGWLAAVRMEGDERVMAMYRLGESGRWAESATIALPPGAGAMGGKWLDLGDDRLVVADPTEGAVHVFERGAGASGWETAEVFGPPRGVAGPGNFGFSVASVGDEVLVGRVTGEVVHRFRKRDGTWTPVGTLTPGDDEARRGYVWSLAAEGGTLLVGGPRRFSVYHRSEGSWVRAGDWPLSGEDDPTAASPQNTLSLAGQVAVVADPGADFGMGAVLVFSDNSGEWVQSGRLVAGHAPLAAISGGEVACEDGEAAGFDCDHVDLLSFVPWEELGGARGARLNDVWGWTDPETGREYAIVCLMDGTSFVDVTDPSNPRFLGNLPMTEGSRANTWRDAKVFNNHAFIVADGAGEHGMQVFDLTRLRDVTESEVFEADALYTGITSSHNVAINEATGFAYLVGSSGEESCGGGSHMVDINDPLNPVFAGCFAHPNTGRRGTGSSHDAQCVIYHGPDEDYRDREICVNSNETALSVADVTDKDNPVAVASAAYPNVAYAHQGWLTEDHRYFYSNDELDEVNGLVEATRTLIWDLEDLDDPLLLTEYFSPTQATDHNLYIRGNRLYMTNNRAGLRVLDISDPENPVEVGHFDTTPWSNDEAGFDGTWSVYPYFESGTVLLSSRREGLFIVKPRPRPLIP